MKGAVEMGQLAHFPERGAYQCPFYDNREDTSRFAEEMAFCVNNSQRTYSYRNDKVRNIISCKTRPIPLSSTDKTKTAVRGSRFAHPTYDW